MNKYDVIIPGWLEGKPLTVKNVPGDTPHDAYRAVLNTIGSLYDSYGLSRPDSLPLDTQVIQVF